MSRAKFHPLLYKVRIMTTKGWALVIASSEGALLNEVDKVLRIDRQARKEARDKETAKLMKYMPKGYDPLGH